MRAAPYLPPRSAGGAPRTIRPVPFSGTDGQPQTSKKCDVPGLDDNSLVKACRAGQTEAFGALVLRYQDRLYPTILRLIGSAEDAKDVMQDTFLRAFEKLDQFQGDSSFYTWVYRIAVNLALSGHRRRRVRSLVRPHGERPAKRGEEPADESPESDPPFLSSGPSASGSSRRPSTSCVPSTVPSSC